jgi:diguanylate cyclase (GGDEF)-like protein/PAS domain S-box-containing protein
VRGKAVLVNNHPLLPGRCGRPVGFLARRWRRYAFAARLGTCFLAITMSVFVVGFFGVNNYSGYIIWIANGLLLTYLLLAPRWNWPAYLAAGFAGLVVGSVLIHEPWQVNLFYNALDLLEVTFIAFLLRRKSTQLPRFTHRAYLIRFLGIALLAGPLLAGTISAVVSAFLWHKSPLGVVFGWMVSDCLGISVACPILVAIFRSRSGPAHNWRRDWIYLALLVAITLTVFAKGNAPVLFLIYPALVLVLLRLGLGWAAAGALFVAFTGGWFTLHGSGPLSAATSLSADDRALLLQIFVASGVFMLYSVSVVLESRRSIEQRLEKIASLHALVTENSRDAIMVADLNNHWSYASRAVEHMTGWPLKEFVKTKVFDLLHPEDLPNVEARVQEIHSGAEGAMIECRVRKYSGDYIWVEASLRMARNPKTGAPSGILNIVRDVTERKRFEESRAFHHSLIRAIYEVSLEGILVVNNEGNVVSYNNRFADIWRVRKPDTPAGLNEETTPIPDGPLLSEVASRVQDRESFLARVRQLYADPRAIDQCEILLKDGRTLERYSTSVRSEGSQYLGRVWFFRDISERKFAEAKLQDAYKVVEALAATDSLTGLANRRRFDQVLISEWRRGLRDQSSLSLLMIDADLFKAYNDTYGHPRGDSCLKQIAEAAQDVLARPSDLVARFGGEEFAVILPHTGSDGALKIARGICEAVRGRRLPHDCSPLGIMTVSIGCATAVPSLGRHAVNLIELADEALYRAKRAGRNRICSSEAMEDDSVELQNIGEGESITVKSA